MTALRDTAILSPQDVAALLTLLQRQGYEVLGPTLVQGDFVHRTLRGMEDLPRNRGMEQEAGRFRLTRRQDGAFFAYPVGQESWKKVFLPPERRLWQAHYQGGGWEIQPEPGAAGPVALFGVRPCDLAALQVLDRIFLKGAFPEPYYQQQRQQALVVAVNCTQPGGTCFCASMGTGPRAASGYDLALTEMVCAERHWFLAEAGGERGRELLGRLPHKAAGLRDAAAVQEALGQAASGMGRVLDTQGLQELLYANYEHRQWAEVAARCLTCGNCAMVCPTCFCHAIEDTLDLKGAVAARWRRQDVCFTLAHSYIHGGSVRATPRARYRQWLIHKLATWQDQFGCLGCVGCGRCLTWCPVGIDLTAEVAAIRCQPEGAGGEPVKE